MSKLTDVLYGRRGGRMAGTGRDLGAAPLCSVCAGPMHVGQHGRHFMCSPPCRCGWPTDLLPDDHDCTVTVTQLDHRKATQ